MDPNLLMTVLSLSTFFGMLLFLYIGTKVKKGAENCGAIHNALFALLGLLIAFTFTGAYERFNQRRHLIVEEANDIGTAYLRLDLLPADKQPLLRAKFLDYVDGRIAFYQKLIDKKAALNELEKESLLQKEIWHLSLNAAAEQPARMLLLPALNQMFDISTTRKNAILTHAPFMIVSALIGLAFICAFLAGIGMAKTPGINWLHALIFSSVTAFFIFLILDIEYPRYGFIRLDKTNELLMDVRQNIQSGQSSNLRDYPSL